MPVYYKVTEVMKIREINEVKTPDLQTKSTNLNLVQLSAVSCQLLPEVLFLVNPLQSTSKQTKGHAYI